MKKIIINTFLLLTGCLISLVILEGFLRIYNPFDLRIKGDKIVLPVNRNYSYKANIDGLDNIIIHKKNSLGFRGEEPPVDFNEYLTIITVGGSTTECALISDGKTWPDRLKVMLKNDFPRLWLNNAGLVGHSTFAHIILLNDYIVKIKPKVALFLIGINDLGRSAMTDRDAENVREISIASRTSLKGIYRSLSANSELLSLMFNFYRYSLAKSMGLVHNKVELDEMGQLELNDSYCEKMESLHKKNYLPGYEARLKEVVRICKTNGIEPVIITQPILWGDGIDCIKNINLANIKIDQNTNGKLEWEILELYNDISRNVAAKEDILLIDLATKMPKCSIYFYDGIHYTNRGAEKVAEIIYKELSPSLKKQFFQ